MIPYYMIWAGIATGFYFLGTTLWDIVDPLHMKKK